MTLRAFAERVVRGTTLDDKLAIPALEASGLEDSLRHPGAREAPIRITEPGRPPGLAIVSGRSVRVPPIAGMRDPAQRARILHALANHELQAIELFAWALLAYPDAPAAFRRGLVAILVDEQRHFGLYRERLAALGVAFGDHPVTGHFWNKLDHLATPIDFVCAMGLTFENANLDFAGEYARAARACGDVATAEALERVHLDEIRHVHFAYVWLVRFDRERSVGGARSSPKGESGSIDRPPWQVYLEHAAFPLGPRRARGATFDREARERAGLDAAFIDALAATEPTRPSGEKR